MTLFLKREEMNRLIGIVKGNGDNDELCGFLFTYGSNIKDVVFLKNRMQSPFCFCISGWDVFRMKLHRIFYGYTMMIPFHSHYNFCEVSARDALDLPEGVNCIISPEKIIFFNLRRNREILYRDDIPVQVVE